MVQLAVGQIATGKEFAYCNSECILTDQVSAAALQDLLLQRLRS